MPQAIDLTGQRFGRLVAVGLGRPAPRGVAWRCLCDCGVTIVTLCAHLRSGRIKSCGCLRAEQLLDRGRELPTVASQSPLFACWRAIINRCERRAEPAFPRYGGRGIYMCAGWRANFVAFVTDMGPRPSPDHSIDRRDNDGSYTCGKCPQCIAKGAPANCRWATQREQNRNTSANMVIEFRGERRCLKEWAEVTGIGWSTIHARLRSGWSAERALLAPVAPKAKPGEGKYPRRRYSSKAKMIAAKSRDGDRITLAVEAI